MKVIFLDIDGVLCTPETLGWGYVTIQGQHLHHFQPDCVSQLNRVTRETSAVFVISSTWRFFGQQVLEEHFKNEGIEGKIIDVTPNGVAKTIGDKKLILSAERGLEIQDWLDRNGHLGIDSFCIIDDSSDMVHLMPKLIHTKWRDASGGYELDGLTKAKADEAIEMLGRK